MREFFYREEEKVHTRLLTLKELVAEQEIHTTPYPLLTSQLNELGVLCRKLQDTIRTLEECVKKAGKS